MVDKVFGDKVLTKQDPFHVIQRLTEKLSEQSQRKALSKQLSRAMYDVENKIRAPDAMAERFVSVLSEVQRSSIRVSIPVWENCIAVNADQIRAGDLFVEENEYLERGKKIRVVSTSQLEAVHSKLWKLLDRIVSIEVGMRILDIFLLQHNLKTGAKFKRYPSFAEFDFVALCQTAVICRGVIPDSPQLEFIHELLAFQNTTASVQQRLRPDGDSAVNRPWERVYGVLTVSIASVEASMLRKRAASSDIRQLLTSVHVNRKLVSQEVFVQRLGLEVEYESTAEFSSNEFSLLEQIRKEQLALDERTYWWRECVVVKTVLYNASVRQLDNPSLKLRKRCLRTIDKYLATIDAKLKSDPTQPSTSSILRLKLDEHGKPNDDVNSEDDECLQKKLFNLLRVKSAIK
ncbi:hypothetical protein PR001_g29485 [Phytophthora rubi]|uniref:Uncharacterized protein n=1 Tax=Phytophthora rubi TaxID=129364 RepID=A0A6A3H1Y9_9STRA|nr:hypothetical protein PR001_g29485 [Phytophthora rubi]